MSKQKRMKLIFKRKRKLRFDRHKAAAKLAKSQ